MEELTKEKIEKIEREKLIEINNVLSANLDNFYEEIEKSMKFIYFLTLPLIMSSISDKSYNPFSEIYEKYISYLLVDRFRALGYLARPLGYSSDLTFESDNFIINIDVKTANIDNTSDYKNVIPIGENQTSYPAKLPIGKRGMSIYFKDGIDNMRSYPNLPQIYKDKRINKEKLNLTYGLLFLYPEYKIELDKNRPDYLEMRENIQEILPNIFKNTNLFTNNKEILDILQDDERKELYIDNVIKKIFIHKEEVKEVNKQMIKKFFDNLDNLSSSIFNSKIKPIAIILISIPNGKLQPDYNDNIVSGKSYGKSIRYHYQDAKFKNLSNDYSRVLFIDYDEEYKSRLEKEFDRIVALDHSEITK